MQCEAAMVREQMQVSEDRVQWRLEALLQDWAQWCMSYRPRLGFPSGVWSGGGFAESKTFEDMCSECDGVVNRNIEAAIDDLTPAQRAAVYRHYGIAAVFRFPRTNYAEQLDQAHTTLRRALPRRGVMLDY